MASVAILLFVAFIGTSTLSAQSFGIGDNVLGLSVGVGGNYVTSSSQSPALGLSFEHGLTQLGPGTLGIGGYLGYKSLH